MIRIGIVGGTGYTGVELLRLLAQHPEAQVDIITSRGEDGRPVADLFPSLRGHYELCFTAPDLRALGQCDVVFFATPHGVAQSMMASLMEAGTRVIDLSADFRIRHIDTWEAWYGQTHGSPQWVDKAIYGLPEINRDKIREAQLIACPGCYPTSIVLGFLPLIERGLVDPASLIANSASGITGAGRQAKIDLLLAENSENFKAYATSGHRHLPETEQILRDIQPAGDSPARLLFVPHLLPMIRGIHSTLYARLTSPDTDLQALYEERYEHEPFVDVLPAGKNPETRTVRGTNVCRIAVSRPGNNDTALILVAEDNLTKGAAGQAIQNMNIMFDLKETTGLNFPALMP